jgi:hypothetical protein
MGNAVLLALGWRASETIDGDEQTASGGKVPPFVCLPSPNDLGARLPARLLHPVDFACRLARLICIKPLRPRKEQSFHTLCHGVLGDVELLDPRATRASRPVDRFMERGLRVRKIEARRDGSKRVRARAIGTMT